MKRQIKNVSANPKQKTKLPAFQLETVKPLQIPSNTVNTQFADESRTLDFEGMGYGDLQLATDENSGSKAVPILATKRSSLTLT